ncbi:MAG TPA: tyrosine--tRNA ligase [Candidatus Saccharimonadales bacterium]|nr:tyrosine--tRNA ligase [Candidatus Saccharimonadales bacterium]
MSDMTLSEELQWRGFVNQTTFENIKDIDKQKWTFYHGFDASADSQTVGNLAGMMFDKVLMRHGNKAYILAGGATSLIGDPIWKDAERPLQDEATIAHNVENAKKQLQQIFKGYDFTLVNNLDWTKDLTVIRFLRDIGKHFSMTPLIQRDYMATRLGDGGTGISFTEFTYTLLQGMDFLHLFDNYGVTLQVGSSDQWGNCLSGVELIRRSRGAEAHVLTHPLVINKATGKKFGRSEAGAVWLDQAKTSPNDFYQFWINADDAGVEEYLKVYTELDKPTIDGIMQEHRQNPKARTAQTKLAEEITKLVHGEQAVTNAQKAATELTGGDISGDSSLVKKYGRDAAFGDLAALLESSGLASSKSEARRLLESGGIYVNDAKATKNNLEQTDFTDGRAKLRRGKTLKNSVIIELTD